MEKHIHCWVVVAGVATATRAVKRGICVLTYVFFGSLQPQKLICVKTPKMRFLHLIRPVMCVLPEVASPDRKVRLVETNGAVVAAQSRVALSPVACVPAFTLPLTHSIVRSHSARKYFGRPSPSSYFSCAVRSQFMAFSPPSRRTHSTGCVSSWLRIEARLWS
jgi:hypothetical protein